MIDILYRRPRFVKSVSVSSFTGSGTEDDEKSLSGTRTSFSSNEHGTISGIPQNLSFERIIDSGTCPPCTERDFMNYLLYIERTAENLQFFLWCRDYQARFQALGEQDKMLSPEWTKEKAALIKSEQKKPVLTSGAAQELMHTTNFSNPAAALVPAIPSRSYNPFDTPPRTPAGSNNAPWDNRSADQMPGNYKAAAEEAFRSVDTTLQPFTIQPFRDELNRIIALYIAEGAPRELNVTAREREEVLRALEQTTHPSAFRNLKNSIEYSLRAQSHPNFIRWTLCNGNRPRYIFARGLGITLVLFGLLSDILLTLSCVGRGWRVTGAILLVLGIATLVCGMKGMCVVLHGMHHRHLRPWELFPSQDIELKKDNDTNYKSYEDQPWVVKYEKRNIIRKIFDKEVWIEEPALRQLQDTIFIQSMGMAILISVCVVGIFAALPHGYLY